MASSPTTTTSTTIMYATEKVGNYEMFYRRAGDENKPVILLLHGFPTSSFMYRNLIPKLAVKYRVIAPDYIGFGYSSMPTADQFQYTFENLYEHTMKLVHKLKLTKFSIYVQDYGAPIGFRIAYRNPDMIEAIITQNGNAYQEGFGKSAWEPIIKYQKDRSNEKEIINFFSLDSIKWQYTHGVSQSLLERVSPDTWHLDYLHISRPGNHKIQLDLLYDYQNNVTLYPDFHKYFKEKQPKLLAIWGNKDEFFIPAGAEAFKNDIPNTKVILVDGGHFILEYHCDLVAKTILEFN